MMKIFQTYCKSFGLALVLALTSVNANTHSVNHKAISVLSKKHGHDKAENKYSNIDKLIREHSLSGDDHLIEKGWMIWRSLPVKTPKELLQGAWLAQAEHRFTYARKLVAQALAFSPNNPQAWLLEASIANIQGDKKSAQYACRQVAVTVSMFASVTCHAKLAKSNEEIKKAYDTLSQLLLLPMDHIDKEFQAWIYSTTADLAKSLEYLSDAERLFSKAMAILPSVQNRTAYMDILLNKKQYHKVLTLIPEGEPTPALSMRRLLAQKALDIDIEEKVQKLDHLFKHWLSKKDFRHAREMALFYLDIVNDVKLAYELARKNIAIQKEVEDRDLLERSVQQLKNIHL